MHDTLLTDRQLEIICHLCNGLSQEEIANTMNLSVSAINNHVIRARTRVGAKTTVHLASIAIAQGNLYWTDDGERSLEQSVEIA
jgi:DNA-binding CsgD family transcriptional regulator